MALQAAEEACVTQRELTALIQDVLSDAFRSGSPGKFTAQQLAQVIAVAYEPPGKSDRPISHWTARELADVHEIKAYVAANRTLTTPFDIVINGTTGDLTNAQIGDKLAPWVEAGATWWVEGLWEATESAAKERIRRGPPKLV